jgi:hypothetical protein
VAALNTTGKITKENAADDLAVFFETIEIKEQIRFEQMIQAAGLKGSSTFISDLKVLLKDYANLGLFEGWGRHHRAGVQAFLAQPDLLALSNEDFLRKLGPCIGGLPESGTLRARVEYVAQKFGVQNWKGLMTSVVPSVSTPFADQAQAVGQGPGIELHRFAFISVSAAP